MGTQAPAAPSPGRGPLGSLLSPQIAPSCPCGWRPALDATCGKTMSSPWRSPLGSDVFTGFPPRLLCQVAHPPPTTLKFWGLLRSKSPAWSAVLLSLFTACCHGLQRERRQALRSHTQFLRLRLQDVLVPSGFCSPDRLPSLSPAPLWSPCLGGCFQGGRHSRLLGPHPPLALPLLASSQHLGSHPRSAWGPHAAVASCCNAHLHPGPHLSPGPRGPVHIPPTMPGPNRPA